MLTCTRTELRFRADQDTPPLVLPTRLVDRHCWEQNAPVVCTTSLLVAEDSTRKDVLGGAGLQITTNEVVLP